MDLISTFAKAETFVRKNFPDDLQWSRDVIKKRESISKHYFFIEYVWAVYLSGFKAKIVRDKWEDLTKAYKGFWVSKILEDPEAVKSAAMKIIGNERKIDSILKGTKIISELDWDTYREEINRDLDVLKRLPYIGDVLKYQVARAIGINTIKPDVHIKRMAEHFEMDPFEMCEKLSEYSGLPVHTVDSIIWRASEQRKIKFGE